MLMRFSFLLAVLPVSMAAEFDKCARASPVWAGVDQGIGISEPHGVSYFNGNIYIVGYAMGNMSFHTQHKDGYYRDHAGANNIADVHTDVTVHHETKSFATSDYSQFSHDGTSTHGMDAVIYQVTEAGTAVKVFGVDSMSADSLTNKSSVNGDRGGYAEFFGIDAFRDVSNSGMVAAGGAYFGKLTVPMSDGSDKVLINANSRPASRHGRRLSNDEIDDKSAGYDRRRLGPHLSWSNQYGFVAKVNMNSGKAVWATDEGLSIDGERFWLRSTVATAAGHVLVTGEDDDTLGGTLLKYDGTSGAMVWRKNYDSFSDPNGAEADADTETVYVTGKLTGTEVKPFGTNGPLTTSSGGDAIVAALDVSGSNGPVARWIVQIGQGEGASVRSHGDHLYAHGSLSRVPSTIGSCSLSGTLGGYLIKLNKATGACVWAKDVFAGRNPSAVSDGNHVWTFGSMREKNAKISAEHSVYLTSTAPSAEQVVVAKYDATDGAGQWAEAILGDARDNVGGYSANGQSSTMTPSGPIYVGYTESNTISLGSLTINNLQHRDVLGTAAPVPGNNNGPNGKGSRAFFSMLISKTDKPPPCIESCEAKAISAATTTIATGQCYAHGECLADGVISSRASFACFKCDAAGDQKALSGQATNDPIDDFCYVDKECIPNGAARDEYQNRNEPSVCEWCDPAVDKHDWSLRSGFVHDRTFARDVEKGQLSRWGRRLQAGEAGQANDFGMLFEKESNGCQILPAITMPASPSADLAAALVAPTSGAIADVATRASDAIAAVRSATSTNQHAEIAWALYIGNDCAGDPCPNTPAALADAMGQEFDTHLHYGDSVARVKVHQGLSMLIDALNDPASKDADIADLKKDIVAHMLIPYYQGAINSSHHMDVAGADNDSKGPPKAEGKAYWSVINDAAAGDGGDFIPIADRNYIMSVFSSATAGDSFAYCAVWDRLLNNLPPASNLQYVNYVRQGTMATIAGDSVVHMTDKDVGTLPRAPTECVMPPPPQPPQPPQPPMASPAPPSAPMSSTSNSLSDGNIAGVAVGAGLGAILLLLVIGLVLRAFLFKETKPIFTCLLGAEETTKTPAASVDPSKV